MAEDNLEYSPVPHDSANESENRGAGFFVEIHLTEDAEEFAVAVLVQDFLARGHSVSDCSRSHRRIDVYIWWSYDQDNDAEELKRSISTLPFVRLLIIQYAYDPRKGG